MTFWSDWKSTSEAKALVRALADDNTAAREKAIVGLSKSESPKAFRLLIKALGDQKSARTRIGAANALGLRGLAHEGERSKAFDVLRERIPYESPAAATSMALAMRNTGDPRAVDAFIGMSGSRLCGEMIAGVRALMLYREPRIFDALAQALKSHDLIDVMKDSALALAAYDDPRAVGMILERVRNLHFVTFVDDNDNVYSYKEPFMEMFPHFLAALRAIKHPDKVPILVSHLRDKHQHVAILSAIALGETQDERARPALKPLLTDADEGLREAAKAGIQALDRA